MPYLMSPPSISILQQQYVTMLPELTESPISSVKIYIHFFRPKMVLNDVLRYIIRAYYYYTTLKSIAQRHTIRYRKGLKMRNRQDIESFCTPLYVYIYTTQPIHKRRILRCHTANDAIVHRAHNP